MKIIKIAVILFLLFIYAPLHAATYVVQAKGMMCESCIQTVTDGFMKIEGVQDVTIDLINQTITIESDSPIDAETATIILTDRGYEFIEFINLKPISSSNE